jgi:hypothetical protein
VTRAPSATPSCTAASPTPPLDSPGGVYDVVDDHAVTKREYAQACSGRLGLLLGDRLTSITRTLRVRNALLRDVTGWMPRYPSVQEGYRVMAASPPL